MLAKVDTANPRAIAQSVKPAELIDVEKQLAEIDAKIAAKKPELDAIYAIRQNDANAHAINAKIAEMNELAGPRNALRQRQRALREQHGLVAAKALDPIRREAAAAMHDLLVDLDVQWSILDETVVATEHAGGTTIRLPKPNIQIILATLTRIMGGGGK